MKYDMPLVIVLDEASDEGPFEPAIRYVERPLAGENADASRPDQNIDHRLDYRRVLHFARYDAA